MSERGGKNGDNKTELFRKGEKVPPELHRVYLDLDTDEEEFGPQETPEPESESPPEPEKPVFEKEDLDKLVQYVTDLASIPESVGNIWETKSASDVIREYFQNPAHVVLTISYKNVKEAEIKVILGFPEDVSNVNVTYFLRSITWQIFTVENFLSTVIFGSVYAVERTVLSLMENMYSPLALKHPEWPIITKNAVFSNLNDFLESLTTSIYKSIHVTRLHVPREVLSIRENVKFLKYDEEDSTSSGKELFGRLERVAGYWIQHVREALASLSLSAHRETPESVAEELCFWKFQYENLAALGVQLTNDRVREVVDSLAKVEVANAFTLQSLIPQVIDKREEAKSNVEYLSLLADPCGKMWENSPKDSEPIILNALFLAMFIWTESPFYNTLQHAEILLNALGNQIVMNCQNHIDFDAIFQGDPLQGKTSLDECIECCYSYSNFYDKVLAVTMEEGKKIWNLPKERVFFNIEAFIGKCRHMVELCQAIFTFGRCDTMGTVGSIRGKNYEVYCRKVSETFCELLQDIREICLNVSNVSQRLWSAKFRNFFEGLFEVENMMKNLIDALFRDVRNVEEYIETLYALRGFQTRRSLRRTLHFKWLEAWKMFTKEFEKKPMIDLEDQYNHIPSLRNCLLISKMSQAKDNYLKAQFEMLMNASDWLLD